MGCKLGRFQHGIDHAIPTSFDCRANTLRLFERRGDPKELGPLDQHRICSIPGQLLQWPSLTPQFGLGETSSTGTQRAGNLACFSSMRSESPHSLFFTDHFQHRSARFLTTCPLPRRLSMISELTTLGRTSLVSRRPALLFLASTPSGNAFRTKESKSRSGKY